MSQDNYTEVKNLLSFVIPCYRSENTIESVYQEIRQVVAERPDYSYEIIAVNDCSPDGVLSVLRHLASEDSSFRVVSLSRNFGKHSAIMAGLSFVRGELVVCLDDDLQCPVPELWRMVDAVRNENFDCATAAYHKKQEVFWKRIGSRFNSAMVSLLINPPDGVQVENFFVAKRFVCDEILRYRNPYPYVTGLLMQATHRICMIPMEQRARGDEKNTGFTLKKSLSLFLNGMTSFSVKPLRLASFLGIMFAFLGFLYSIIIIVRKLVNPSVPLGYSSMMAVSLLSSGIIMLILGMIGEYLGRIYISLNNSPQYVIRETLNISE
ncbi:MAG: glycosyltransferase family 2 protein [Oscillospiraceae bacterium]|nr:glycosyltransferase family 2 protein [Oscillospiraceae bacterium]